MKLSPKAITTFHLIIVPGIFVTILMFSGNIKTVVGMFWDESWAEFDDVFYYDLLLVFFINGNYLFRWKKTPTEKFFESLGHDYIISERTILQKFRKTSIIITIALLTILIVYSSNNNQTETYSLDLIELFLFSVSFASVITFSNCYYKIHDQDSKKHFRLFVASGYFKNAMRMDDEFKTKLIEKGLNWLNEYYKSKKHLHIIDLEKINLKIIEENSKGERNTIEKISNSFESGVENSGLQIIAELMGKNILDLLVKVSTSTRIKEWMTPIATVIITITTIISLALTIFRT